MIIFLAVIYRAHLRKPRQDWDSFWCFEAPKSTNFKCFSRR